jgi:hypothetical protein
MISAAGYGRAWVPPRDRRAASAYRSLLIPRWRRQGDHAGGITHRSVGQGPGRVSTPCISLLISRRRRPNHHLDRRTAAAAQHPVVKNNANTMEAQSRPPHRRLVYSLKPLNFFQKTS